MTAPNRRWLRFNLRTLFVVVTVASLVAGWCMWHVNEESQRELMLVTIKERGGDFLWGVERAGVVKKIFGHVLGSRPISGFLVPGDLTADELRGLERLFPEAETWERLCPKGEDPTRMKPLRIP